jgi:hypothetical protein
VAHDFFCVASGSLRLEQIQGALHDCAVDGHFEIVCVGEAVGSSEHLDERLLHRIFRVRSAFEDSQRDRVSSIALPFEQITQRFRFAGLPPPGQALRHPLTAAFILHALFPSIFTSTRCSSAPIGGEK